MKRYIREPAYYIVLIAFGLMLYMQLDIYGRMSNTVVHDKISDLGDSIDRDISDIVFKEAVDVTANELRFRHKKMSSYDGKWKLLVYGFAPGHTFRGNGPNWEKYSIQMTSFLKHIRLYLKDAGNTEVWFIRMNDLSTGKLSHYGFDKMCFHGGEKCFDRYFHDFSQPQPRSGKTTVERDAMRLSKIYRDGMYPIESLPLYVLVNDKGQAVHLFMHGSFHPNSVYEKIIRIQQSAGVDVSLSDEFFSSKVEEYPSFFDWLGEKNRLLEL